MESNTWLQKVTSRYVAMVYVGGFKSSMHTINS